MKATQPTAKKQRNAKDDPEFFGLPLGRTVNGGMEVFASVEDVGTIIAGPRVGKSAAYVIPFMMVAKGPVLVTSNKNDIHHHTRGIREEIGRVFVFDPQRIAVSTDQGWWFNPLRGVTGPSQAMGLAELIEAAEGRGAAGAAQRTGGDFFSGRGKTLLRALFLAAAVSEGWTDEPHSYVGPMYFLRDVLTWLSEPETEDPAPVRVLEKTPYRSVYEELVSIYRSAPQERSGVFSTAQLLLAFLADAGISDWVNPRPGEENHHGGRLLFDPALFMEGNNTLYSLSNDDYGNAPALVTALTQQVITAATTKADASYGGRLPLPMTCILDEAANVCPWPQLPQLYSYFGSKGILVWTILQTYNQAVRVWGEDGTNALLGASSHLIYAGGNKPGPLLRMIEAAVGEYYYTTPGSPGSRNSAPGPKQEHKDKVLDEAELTGLPRGRAVLVSIGFRPGLLRTVPWMANPVWKAKIEASVRAYDPQAEKTLLQEYREFEASQTNPDLTTAPAA